MPANLWKSLTIKFMALGHSLHEAECIAAVIVIDCLVMYTIMGYRFSDAEREQPTEFCRAPDSHPVMAGTCGSVPACVDRDGILLHCQLNPAGPGGWKEQSGIADTRGISSAVMQYAALVRW